MGKATQHWRLISALQKGGVYSHAVGNARCGDQVETNKRNQFLTMVDFQKLLYFAHAYHTLRLTPQLFAPYATASAKPVPT